jgi:hypothetical protein
VPTPRLIPTLPRSTPTRTLTPFSQGRSICQT